MKSFFEKEIYTIGDIESLVEFNAEENVYLDFKAGPALTKSKKDLVEEIAKDVSAFANSDGGIIIYGIQEEGHRAGKFNFVDGNLFSKERLEHIISNSIQRNIQGIEIIPFRKDDRIEQSIYLVKIPRSSDAPHMTKDQKFYKRRNFENVLMEEYEIRDCYNRISKTELAIIGFYISPPKRESDDKWEIPIEVIIQNIGGTTENVYKTNVYLNIEHSVNLSFTWDRHQGDCHYTPIGNGRSKISAGNTAPLFPDESVTGIRFRMIVSNDDIWVLLKNTTLDSILFYSNGKDEISGDFTNTLQTFKKNFKFIKVKSHQISPELEGEEVTNYTDQEFRISDNFYDVLKSSRSFQYYHHGANIFPDGENLGRNMNIYYDSEEDNIVHASLVDL